MTGVTRIPFDSHAVANNGWYMHSIPIIEFSVVALPCFNGLWLFEAQEDRPLKSGALTISAQASCLHTHVISALRMFCFRLFVHPALIFFWLPATQLGWDICVGIGSC